MGKEEMELATMWCVIFYDFGDRRHIEFYDSYDLADKRMLDVNGFMCPDYRLQHCLERYFPPVFIDV